MPADPALEPELDVTDLELTTRRFSRALLRHEIARVEPGPEGVVDLSVRTWDPGLQLPLGPVAATLRLSAGRGLSQPFRLDAVRPGLYEGAVRLDLAAVRMPPHGFAGTRHPTLTLTHRGERNSGPLLAPLDFPGQRGTVGGHLVRVEPEGRGAGRLQIVWERQGATARIEPLLLPLQRTAGPRLRRARKLWRGLTKN
jgi:hypothetical protein